MASFFNEIDEIIKKAEEKTIHSTTYGLKRGLIGVVIFFLFCYRVTKNKQYEYKAFDLLKQILSAIDTKISIYPNIQVEICNSLCFLQSNCPDYTMIQQLREAGINNDKKKIKYLLAALSKESPDAVIQGLACMSLDKPSLPPWWKLF